MNVTSGLTFQRSGDGNFRKLSISISGSDLVRLVDDGRVEGYVLDDDGEDRVKIVDGEGNRMPTPIAYKVLQAEADCLLWQQVFSEGGCQREVAAQQIKDARARAGILLAKRNA